jgi:hypothetical protein
MATPLQSQQAFEVRFPIELREIAELFACPDKARTNSKFILDCHHNAPFAAAIEFGHDQASEFKRVVELARLT